MKYDEFIYEFIKLLMSWGVWKDSAKINYGRIIFSPCQMPESTSDQFYDYEDYCKRKAVFEADKERNAFRDLQNVVISETTETDIEFQSDWPERCEMLIEFNGPLNNLFSYGILETDLCNLPLGRRIEAYHEREKYREEFHEEYDVEEIQNHPEEYGFPSELEFDSSDEYKEFFEAEMNKAEQEFIENMSGTIEYGNNLEAEICDLCIKHGLSYDFTGDGLYIGHDYF